jgi:hypothetical protein
MGEYNIKKENEVNLFKKKRIEGTCVHFFKYNITKLKKKTFWNLSLILKIKVEREDVKI